VIVPGPTQSVSTETGGEECELHSGQEVQFSSLLSVGHMSRKLTSYTIRDQTSLFHLISKLMCVLRKKLFFLWCPCTIKATITIDWGKNNFEV